MKARIAAALAALFVCALLPGCADKKTPDEPAPVGRDELQRIEETFTAYERFCENGLVCRLDFAAPENEEAFRALSEKGCEWVIDTALATCCKTKEEALAHARRYLSDDFARIGDDVCFEHDGKLFALIGAKGSVEYRPFDPESVRRDANGNVTVPLAWNRPDGVYGGSDLLVMSCDGDGCRVIARLTFD